jgi:RNA polymerase sigma factor (sigma-70 family)
MRLAERPLNARRDMPGSEGSKSFAAIVPLYASAMLRVAAALIGPAEAEDAVQEASMRAWQSWSTLRNVDAVRPWLLHITLNVCRQWRRGLKGQQQAHLQALPEATDPEYRQLFALLESDPGTSNHTGALDLRAAINALPSDLRGVVVLRYYAGLDASEIGELLSLPAGTVRSRLHRALLEMRERLQPSDLASTTRSAREDRS